MTDPRNASGQDGAGTPILLLRFPDGDVEYRSTRGELSVGAVIRSRGAKWRVREYVPEGYPAPADLPGLVPHGFAVAVNAPAAFRYLASTDPVRHAEAARLLDPTVGEVGHAEAGEALAGAMSGLMRRVGAPNGVAGVGYGPDDVSGLVRGAAPQRRLLDNAPADIHEPELEALFGSAMTCWGP